MVAVLASACGPSTDTLNLTFKERVQVAQEKFARECLLRSAVAAKREAALKGAETAAYLSRDGLAAGQAERQVKCFESQALACSDQTAECALASGDVGKLELGTACLIDLQCASGKCQGGEAQLDLTTTNVRCGACAVSAESGEVCDGDPASAPLECGGGLQCAAGRCEPLPHGRSVRVSLRAPCDSVSRICELGAFCTNDGAASVCARAPKLGEPCALSMRCADGARCDLASQTCVDGAVPVAVGVRCAASDACAAGARCVAPASGSGDSVCASAKIVGESCTAGTDCAPGLFCGAAKTCLDVSKDLGCPAK